MPNNVLQLLQSRLLEYVRSVVKEAHESIQFIIGTSSTALIEKATAEELFKLMPSQYVAESSNPLVKVSDAKATDPLKIKG